MGKLDGRIAIVTGSGRGIGRAIAEKLAAEGARLVINDIDTDPATETKQALVEAGAEVSAVVGDVADPDFGRRIVDHTLERHGRIDVIVNNAGYIWNSTIQKHSDEQWYAMLDVHATAQFRVLRAAAEHFRETAKAAPAGGLRPMRKVVNISSVSGTFGAATQVSYAAAKAAVTGLTRSLAKEWGRYGVTVNCVAFGAVDTRLTQGWQGPKATILMHGRELPVGFPPEALEEMSRSIPLGRPGTPEEAAGAVYLLCIPESDYISGHVLICAGGLTG